MCVRPRPRAHSDSECSAHDCCQRIEHALALVLLALSMLLTAAGNLLRFVGVSDEDDFDALIAARQEYMQQHKEVTLSDLIKDKDMQKILAAYKPSH